MSVTQFIITLLRSTLILLLPAVLLLTGCEKFKGETDSRFSATGEIIALSGGAGGAANACFTCHGLTGEGDGLSVPRLAGQDLGYLQKQMEDYASGLRADPAMTLVARQLSQEDRRRVSAYYADRPAPPLQVTQRPSAPAIWSHGNTERGITACATCHGQKGQGGGGQPAVASQPSAYTVEQLNRFKSGQRRNDPRGVMATAVNNLTDTEAKEIADWLALMPLLPPSDRVKPAQSAVAQSAETLSAVAQPAGTREVRRPARSDGG